MATPGADCTSRTPGPDLYFLKAMTHPCGWRFSSPYTKDCLNDAHSKRCFIKFFGDTLMNTATPNAGPANTGNAAENKQILLKDIGAKWGKFSEQELGALKNRDDLVTQVVAKYSLDKIQAQKDVDAVMKGRQI
jgi:hypothetical protein